MTLGCSHLSPSSHTSMISTAFLCILFAVSIVVDASPTPEPVASVDGDLDSRSSPLCVTIASGTLVTSDVAVGLPDERKRKRTLNRMKSSQLPLQRNRPTRRVDSLTSCLFSDAPFALNSANEIAFYNTTKPTIFAEVQKCTPNWMGASNDGSLHNFDIKYWGRVYIPASKTCIGIEVSDLCMQVYVARL